MTLINLLDLCFDAHFSFFSFLEFLLHLLLMGSRHNVVLSLVLLLSHPLLICFWIVATWCKLVYSLVINDLLFFNVAQLGNVVSFIEFFLYEPGLHLPNSVIMDKFFVLGEIEELWSQFTLLLVDQLLPKPFLGILRSDPLLECWGIPICMRCSCRTLRPWRFQQGDFWAVAYWTLVREALEKYFGDVLVITHVWSLRWHSETWWEVSSSWIHAFVHKMVHVVIPRLVGQL